MKCFYHTTEENTSTCSKCGRGLCQTCTSLFDPPVCYDCAEKTARTNKRSTVLKLVFLILATCLAITVGFILGMTYLESSGGSLVNGFAGAIIALFAIGIPFGWSALNKITPSMFLFLPLIGWLIYGLIKLTLSQIIGAFVIIIKIGKLFIEFGKLSKLQKYIQSTKKIVNE